MTDLVGWLTAELDRVEQVARRAQGTWAGQADGWRITIVDEQGRKVAYLPNRLTAEDPEGDYATATLIEDNDPVAVLRRVAADRQILALHRADSDDRPECVTCGPQYPCSTVRLLAGSRGWTEDTA